MSEKSVAQKLLIKPRFKVLIVNAPEDYRDKLGELPPDVSVAGSPSGPADLVQVFVRSMEELKKQLAGLSGVVKPGGLLWVSYPKGTSGLKSDINRDSIREYARTVGLEGVAMISIDETWSALRLKAV